MVCGFCEGKVTCSSPRKAGGKGAHGGMECQPLGQTALLLQGSRSESKNKPKKNK